MHNIITVFKKELLDTLRDKRTLLMMIFIPVLVIPALVLVVTKVSGGRTEDARGKHLKIAVAAQENGADLLYRLKRRKDLTLIEGIHKDDFRALVREDSLDLALIIDKEFDTDIKDGKTGKITVVYNSTSDGVIYDRIENTLDQYYESVLNSRLQALGVKKSMIDPVDIRKKDVYSNRESLGKMAGGFLPYIFVMFALFGGMYPAIDLFAGEKERATIETILTVPAGRLEILTGKMLVVILAGVFSGLLTIIGFWAAFRLNPDVPTFFSNILNQILTPGIMGLILLMLVPLSVFFSGILIPASIYAKSFKEAQSIIQPMSFIVVFPLLLGMVPAIKLNLLTACIPVLNVTLACKEIIAGTISFSHLAMVFASLIVYAIISVMVCVRWFASEKHIFRV